MIGQLNFNTQSPTGNSITSTIEPTALSSSYNKIKIDLKVYQTFNGQTKDWKKFKIQFSSVATIHGINNLIEEDYLIPDSTIIHLHKQHMITPFYIQC